MKVSMFTKEEMHADHAEFHLLVLISKTRKTCDVGLSRHKQTLRRMVNEARFHHQSLHNENAMHMCGCGMRRAADQWVVVFLSHLPER